MNEKPPTITQEPTQEPKERAVLEFAEMVQNLQKNYYIHGHGVSSNKVADSILEHGLFTAWAALQDISHPLSDNSHKLIKQIRAWDYNAKQCIILIAVPKHKDYFASDVADEKLSAWGNRDRSKDFAKSHIFEPATRPNELQTPLNSDKRIPPEKIIGYWDDTEKIFHPNPRFGKEK